LIGGVSGGLPPERVMELHDWMNYAYIINPYQLRKFIENNVPVFPQYRVPETTGGYGRTYRITQSTEVEYRFPETTDGYPRVYRIPLRSPADEIREESKDTLSIILKNINELKREVEEIKNEIEKLRKELLQQVG